MGGTRDIKSGPVNGTIEEGAVCAGLRGGVKVTVGLVVVGVGRIPGIGGVVGVGMRSRGSGVGARVIGGWRMRGPNIGHPIRVRVRVLVLVWRAWSGGVGHGIGSRGLD